MCRKRRPLSSAPEVTSPPLQRKREMTLEQWLDIITGQVQNTNHTARATTTTCPCFPNANPIIPFSNNESVDSSDDVNVELLFSDISSNDFSYNYSTEVSTVPEPQAMLAGCHHCYMYFMVPDNHLFCPQCTRLLFDVRCRIGHC